jgi:hypothetical protein
MARFTIRIVLHDSSWDDYITMYKHLAAYRITDTITSDNGTVYELPPAEYNYEGDATAQQVQETARQCAAKVAASYAVLVTEATTRTWIGLNVVKRS